MTPDLASYNGIIYNHCSNFQSFLFHGIQRFHQPSSLSEYRPSSAMLSDTLPKDKWAEGKGRNTLLLPFLQPTWLRQLSSCQRHVSADLSALSSDILAENPTFPVRIGIQSGYFESCMTEKPEASFLCCLKTDEAVTHLINHIWRMQRSKNNLRFSQVLKWGH